MNGSLDDLRSGLRRVQDASHEQLRSESWLIDVLRNIGLSKDDVRNEGNLTWQHDNELLGIAQTPEQFAPALLILKDYGIRSILDIGTWSAWNVAFMVTYFGRFADGVFAHTVDRS